MKVKIQNRSVYHKFAEVEIEIDKKEDYLLGLLVKHRKVLRKM